MKLMEEYAYYDSCNEKKMISLPMPVNLLCHCIECIRSCHTA
jgi:hypothetical protein